MILGILTARLASKRLPNKALLTLGGKAMVRYVYDILAKSKVDIAVLCTPDEYLAGFVYDHALVWKGRRDVLGELCEAACKYEADHIVRVTADCPFLTANIINQVIDEHLESRANYTYSHNDFLPSSTKEGLDVEVATIKTLLDLHDTSSDREHLCTNTRGLKVHRVNIIDDRDVFSVNTLEEYIKAYNLIKE